ncbi:MAG: DUF4232 domain-containing protein [Streptosporangiaceae bacterium]
MEHTTKINGRVRRRAVAPAVRCVLMCGVALVAAACGLQKSPQAGHPHTAGTRAAGSHTSAAGPTCTPGDLKISLDVHAAGVAAGTSYLPVDFTNDSPGNCTLDGFPLVTLATGQSGQQVGTAAAADHSVTPPRLNLPAGHTAHIWLHVTSVANLPAAQCHPVTAAGFRITLPGQASAIFLGFPITTCAKPVHGTDVLAVEPFQAGKARRGTAQ